MEEERDAVLTRLLAIAPPRAVCASPLDRTECEAPVLQRPTAADGVEITVVAICGRTEGIA